MRRDGRIEPIELGSVKREIPFSDRARPGVAIPWGDVSTAYHSTGIPNVTVYQTGLADRLDRVKRFGFLLRRPLVRRMLQWWVQRTIVGPDESERASAQMRVWAEAPGADGRSATAELSCPDGYSFTADSATTAVETLLEPYAVGPREGFLTPSLAFGAGFVDRMAGVEWHRLP